ncbi:phosphatase domain-containing protein [Myxococcus qinghaiensis]|uniref:phosphatase domain-containing protein n=1 Tax=Myxococcus qinghaiensis TaxID=2906758 RepID=UPI0020A6F0E4|nr:protein tyrosine phosphatase [Myxococcus qinghaiensis]MCP3164157.1 protein tyrosine phosphatase [Myxococcus qinghaiensis]
MLIPSLAPDATSAVLVLDDGGEEARLLRTTTRPPDLVGLDAQGLAELRCSGSAQLSVAGFRDLVRRLEGVSAESLYVFDLRQESHGFLNGAAVSWYAESNWGAAGLSDEEALALEAGRLRLLARSRMVRVGDAGTVKRREPLVSTEWECRDVHDEARAFELPPERYVRLPVTDHTRPRDETVERFIQKVRSLDEGAHVHLHCRGGKGRTATFMCLLDMLRNAERLSLDALLTRQARLGGYDLRKAADPTSRKAPYIAERRAFIEQFHAYARENPGGAPLGWLAWLARRPMNPEHKG